MRFLVSISFVLFSALLAHAQATPSEALMLEQQGRLPEATKAWRAVTEQNPRDAAAFASLGVVLSKQSKYEEAVGAYRKALACDPVSAFGSVIAFTVPVDETTADAVSCPLHRIRIPPVLRRSRDELFRPRDRRANRSPVA